MLDLHSLPSSLFRDATITGCYEGTCQIAGVSGSAGERYLVIPLSAAATATTVLSQLTKSIELRVDVGGRRVFTASTREQLPVWTKESRCPECRTGNIFAVADRDGSIRSRSPF